MIDKYIMVNGSKIYYDNEVWNDSMLTYLVKDLYASGGMLAIEIYFDFDLKEQHHKKPTMKIVK